jgi:hypothetical protein
MIVHEAVCTTFVSRSNFMPKELECCVRIHHHQFRVTALRDETPSTGALPTNAKTSHTYK